MQGCAVAAAAAAAAAVALLAFCIGCCGCYLCVPATSVCLVCAAGLGFPAAPGCLVIAAGLGQHTALEALPVGLGQYVALEAEHETMLLAGTGTAADGGDNAPAVAAQFHVWLSRLKLELFEAKTCRVFLAESCGNRLKI